MRPDAQGDRPHRGARRRWARACFLAACGLAAACQAPALPPATSVPGLATQGPARPPLAALRLLAVASNDEAGSAAPIAALPFRTSIDTTQASRNLADPTTFCQFGSGTNLWYAFSPTATAELEAWVGVAGNVQPHLEVFDGTVSEQTKVGQCAYYFDFALLDRIQVRFTAEAGHTYLFSVGSGDGGEPGTVQFDLSPYEPFTLSMTVDPVASFVPGTANAIVYGSVRANKPCVVDNVSVQLTQRVGRVPITGTSSDEFGTFDGVNLPDGGEARWSRVVKCWNGTWSGGEADATVYLFETNGEISEQRAVPVKLRLRGKR